MELACFDSIFKDGGIFAEHPALDQETEKKQCLKFQPHLPGRVF
jgi:hypothetical protein